MTPELTGAERYLASRMNNRDYREAYEAAVTVCAEAVVDRDGTLGPCGEQAAGWAVDPVSLYPACETHATDTGRVMRLAVEMLWALRAMDPVVGATVRAVTEAEIAHSLAVLDWARFREVDV